MNKVAFRPSVESYYMQMARLVATRSTCIRRAVGCVLVDKRWRVLGTGYNGTPRGSPHCNQLVRCGKDYEDLGSGVMYPRRMIETFPNACAGAFAKSGSALNKCDAIHAEQNALIQCRDTDEIHAAFVTVSPCDPCVKLLLNTSCETIFVGEWYVGHEAVLDRWVLSGRNRAMTLVALT